MPTEADLPVSTPVLQRLLHLGEPDDKDALELRQNLSGLAGRDGWLWLGGDEGRSVVRLVDQGGDRFGAGQRFKLRDFELAEGREEGESELEGLCLDGDRLWLVGSHSLRRWSLDSDKGHPLRVDPQRSRNAQLLGYLQLDAQGLPLAGRRLAFHRKRGVDALFEALVADPLIAPFTGLPSKDNGLDIEGLVARGDRLLLGLRGPVLRGISLVADLRLSFSDDALLQLEGLRLRCLDLAGLAVRDLAVLPGTEDVLVLAGPTMTLAGPSYLYIWPSALAGAGPGDISPLSAPVREPVEPLLCLRDGRPGRPDHGSDKPEGLELQRLNDRWIAWVAYDDPTESRTACPGQGVATRLDGFALPL